MARKSAAKESYRICGVANGRWTCMTFDGCHVDVDQRRHRREVVLHKAGRRYTVSKDGMKIFSVSPTGMPILALTVDLNAICGSGK